MRRDLITTRARAVRKSMSGAEVILWTRLRGRDPEKPTFCRQHPIGAIILDFYCPSARLAIEVDGATHWDDEAQARDTRRDLWLNSQDIEVMRIPASHVYHQLDSVVDAILIRAGERRETCKRGPYLPREAAGGGPSAKRSEEPMVEGASPIRRLAPPPPIRRA